MLTTYKWMTNRCCTIRHAFNLWSGDD